MRALPSFSLQSTSVSQILAGVLEFSSISLCLGVLCLGLFWDSCLGKRAWEGSGLREIGPEVSHV